MAFTNLFTMLEYEIGDVRASVTGTVKDRGKAYMRARNGRADKRWALMDGKSNCGPGSGTVYMSRRINFYERVA